MARARIQTLLSLDQWAEIMGMSPFWFNQIETDVPTLGEFSCQNVLYQHSWQKNWIGREEVASAIDKAERSLAEHLNFHPAPRYITNERVSYPRSQSLNNPQTWLTPRGEWKAVNYEFQRILELGTFVRTLVSADVAILYSDRYGNGVNDTFTLTLATTEFQDIAEVGLYNSEADRFDNLLDETWRIRPIQVFLNDNDSDGTYDELIIKGHIGQAVKPILYEKAAPDILAVTESSNFVDTFDVYKITVDNTDIGTAHYNARAYRGATSGALNSNTAITDDLLGIVRPQIGLCTVLGEAPDYLKVNYVAGYPLASDGKVHHLMAQMIAYLSIHFLPAVPCGCDRAEEILEYWKRVPSRDDADARPLTAEEINQNPFGVSRGAMYAWRRVLEHQQPFAGRI